MTRVRSFLAAGLLVLAAARGAAQPAIVPDAPVMELDELGVYSVGYARPGEVEREFPPGWAGFFEEQTGVACEPFGAQNGKTAFLLHCPWRHGAGTAFQQLVFCLPERADKILLRGATALRTASVGDSDGVTFRLYANGVKLFDYHQTNDLWRDFEFDFTRLRGTNLTLRFEVDPGPRQNPSFDYSLWGARQLVLEGFTPAQVTRPAPPPLSLANLWSGQTLDPAPVGGFAGHSSSSLSNGVARFLYRGPDGSLDYEWRAPQSTNEGLFGTIRLNACLAGDSPVQVPLAGSASLLWTQPAVPVANGWTQDASGCALWRKYSLGSTTATVWIHGRLLGKTLALSIAGDQPAVAAFNAGSWGPVVRRRQMTVPYYDSPVYYLPRENLFASVLLDWTASAATCHRGTETVYEPRTDGTRVPLAERVLFTPAWHLAEVFPNPPNPPSPWRNYLADKVVLDIWDGKFDQLAANLQALAGYGITRCLAIIHNWQRDGYDNGLPAHYPANAARGGDAAMSNLVAAASALGLRCALHENYVDYYPNYEHFDTRDLALDSSGKPQEAWFNPGTKIQSFAVKPPAMARLAAGQSPEIHARYATTASFIDVCSSTPPWFHVDQRAGEPGAARLRQSWDAHRRLWDFERATHQGPVLGEGNNHWYWSGCLDGVEAQFGAGWPSHGGCEAPLAVEFDLLKIHPLQVNHGMGYYNRWWPTESYAKQWAGGPVPMAVLDRYRMQEAAYGHAGFLGSSAWTHLPLAWLEHHLLSPVAERYAAARPVEILHEANGAWLDATALAKLGPAADWSRVRVHYENGLVVTANGSTNQWTVGSWVLPDSGWVAEGAGMTAGTTLRDGVVTDFVDAGTNVFLNARPAADWNLSSHRRVQPTVASFQPVGVRAFQVTYEWRADDPLPRDYRAFIHFCANGEIQAQQDHSLSPAASQWAAGQIIRDGPWNVTLPRLADGDYEWLSGLFDPAGDNGRVRLQGVDDGSSRIRLGVLRLADQGRILSFLPETNAPATDPARWRYQHLNTSNRVVDFGVARTDGSAWLRRDGDRWRLQTWPRERSFTLELSRRRFASPPEIECLDGSSVRVLPVPDGPWWRLPLNGAAEYRWTDPSPRQTSSARLNQPIHADRNGSH